MWKKKNWYEKIVWGASDEANVLVWKYSGVWAKFRNHCSLIDYTHDGAHRVNLISNEAFKGVQ